MLGSTRLPNGDTLTDKESKGLHSNYTWYHKERLDKDPIVDGVVYGRVDEIRFASIVQEAEEKSE
jgi:hypothetical protein